MITRFLFPGYHFCCPLVCNIESEESVTPNNQPTPAPQASPLRGAGVFWDLVLPNTRAIPWKPKLARFLWTCIVSMLLFVASYCGSAASEEAQFLGEIRQVIFEGKRSGEGYFSPDGQSL